jgi:hypothetical protein
MCLLHVGPDMPTSTGHTLAHRDLTGLILKCFFDVYGELGHGFSELVLRRAMAIALEEAGLRVGRRRRWLFTSGVAVSGASAPT